MWKEIEDVQGEARSSIKSLNLFYFLFLWIFVISLFFILKRIFISFIIKCLMKTLLLNLNFLFINKLLILEFIYSLINWNYFNTIVNTFYNPIWICFDVLIDANPRKKNFLELNDEIFQNLISIIIFLDSTLQKNWKFASSRISKTRKDNQTFSIDYNDIIPRDFSERTW